MIRVFDVRSMGSHGRKIRIFIRLFAIRTCQHVSNADYWLCCFLDLQDILKFLILFILVIIAFVIGLQNLFWYYNADSIEIEQRDFDVPAKESFGE